MKVGTICLKLAGRDAGRVCVVVGTEGDFVVIDGATRRRKCNPLHLEPVGKELKIRENAAHDIVVKELVAAGFSMVEKKKTTLSKSVDGKKEEVKKEEAPVEKKKVEAPKVEEAK